MNLKRQGNIISSLMNNFDIARQALDVSLNSEGSAMEEHAKAMESISAKINQLKASWESLSQSFMGSDFLKASIDGLTDFVQVIDTLIQNFGTIPTLLTGIGIVKTIKDVA